MTDDTLDEIGAINCAWLLFAKRLLQEDRLGGARQIGVTEKTAEILANLSLERVVQLSRSSQLLCRLCIDDHILLKALVEKEFATATGQDEKAGRSVGIF